MLKTFLVPLDGTEAAKPALETAFKLGCERAAHIDVLHVRTDPKNAVPLLGEGMSGAMIEEMIDLAEKESNDRSAEARRMFDQVCAECSVPVVDEAPGPQGASASWIEETGREDEAMVRRGRLADLIVIGRPTPESDVPSNMTLNAVLFETGRPILVAPPGAARVPGRKVAIAWNGSAEAARAVGTSLSFIAEAEEVTILTAVTDHTTSEQAARIAEYLAWHGIDTQPMEVAPEGRSVGEALLSACGERDVDLLIMGAYTHSRMLQLILGGVTRHVLAEATIPLVMAR